MQSLLEYDRSLISHADLLSVLREEIFALIGRHAVIDANKVNPNERAPILLTRTPYNATELTSHAASSHLGPILNGYDNALEVIVEGGYIRVVQDVRGKYGSEGDYVMNRPLRGPLNPTAVDHVLTTASLSNAERIAILGGNAARLLQIPM